MSDETKVYIGTFKKATSKQGLEYYYGGLGGANAVLFPTKDGSGLNLYVSERKPKEETTQSTLKVKPAPSFDEF